MGCTSSLTTGTISWIGPSLFVIHLFHARYVVVASPFITTSTCPAKETNRFPQSHCFSVHNISKDSFKEYKSPCFTHTHTHTHTRSHTWTGCSMVRTPGWTTTQSVCDRNVTRGRGADQHLHLAPGSIRWCSACLSDARRQGRHATASCCCVSSQERLTSAHSNVADSPWEDRC